jgi:hypothetical protein
VGPAVGRALRGWRCSRLRKRRGAAACLAGDDVWRRALCQVASVSTTSAGSAEQLTTHTSMFAHTYSSTMPHSPWAAQGASEAHALQPAFFLSF